MKKIISNFKSKFIKYDKRDQYLLLSETAPLFLSKKKY